MMGRGTAGVAAEPCADGSAVYVNPAGLTGRPGIVGSLGGMLVFGSSRFAADGGGTTETVTGTRAVPHGFFQWGITNRLAVGVGTYIPYGLAIEWPQDFSGRFLSYESELTSAYVQPSVAYALSDRVSVGGGVTFVGIGSIDLRRREDLASVPLGLVPGATFETLVDRGTDFADTALSASGATGVGVNLGISAQVSGPVRVGARYLSKVTLDYEGDVTFTPVGGSIRVTKPNPFGLPVGTPLDPFVTQVQAALRPQTAQTELTMPAQFVVGVSVDATDRLALMGDYQWIGWSVFDTVALDFSLPLPPDEQLVQNYGDTSAVLLGAEYELQPELRLRGGVFWHQAAAPDETVTPLLPEAPRSHLSAGFGWQLHRRLTIDVAYQYIRHEDRRGRVVNPPPGVAPTAALNSGVYRSRGDLLALTFTMRP
jgi:long-chain fatty acid transport protein